MADGPPTPRTDQLASDALDPKKFDDVARAIQMLTPEEAAHFAALLEKQIKQRRIQLIGYLVALVVVMVGMFVALTIWAQRDEGEFVGWVFFVPILAVGIVFYVFGRWSRSIK